MRRIAAAVLFVFSLICYLTCPTLAQEGSATLTGFIQDSSKAVIQGVKVTAIETNTNQRFEATTGKDGSYTIVALPVGPYQMQIEKPGFKTILKDDLFLHTQDALEVNFQMAVGSTSETVTVNSATTNDNPAVSMTVDREFIESMPLNGQSFQDLIQLAPGTVSSGGLDSIDGQRNNSNIYTVDGVSANLGGYNTGGFAGDSPSLTQLGTTQTLASVDALQEFTIQTSGYSAEYGRSPGGQIQLTTRAGTNAIHGSLFDYLRNTVFDANSYTNNYNDIRKTPEHQNDFGGTVGGPVIVPRLYNGKDRTFYFVSYEGLRLIQPASEEENVPTSAFRNWAALGVQPFLNAEPLPSPNRPPNQDGCTIPDSVTAQPIPCDAPFYSAYDQTNRLDSTSVRVDGNLGKLVHAFVRYADTPSVNLSPTEVLTRSATNVHLWTAGLTLNINSHLLDDLRFNFSRDGQESVSALETFKGSIPFPRSILIPPAYDSAYSAGYVAFGLDLLGGPPPFGGAGTVQLQDQLIDSLSWTRGNHSLKFGGDRRRLRGSYTALPYSSYAGFYSLTGFQQGYADQVQIYATEPGVPVIDNFSLYVQDHWKMSPKLSVDYGLRWEINPPPGPSHGSYPVTLTSTDLATATLSQGAPLYKTSYHSFAPRFGFAWNAGPSQKHSPTVRGGVGIFFDTGQSNAESAYEGAYPFQASGPLLTDVPVPLSNSALAPPAFNAPLAEPYGFTLVNAPSLTLPYTEQWNLSIDEMLSTKNTLTASYVGNVGRKLLSAEDFSTNPNFSFLQYTSNDSQSNYHALQVQDVGRLASGLDLVASFTWAHALDNVSTDASQYAPIYGNSDNDVRRMLHFALNYHTPTTESNGWGHAMTHGWLFANRVTVQGGYPLAIVQYYGYSPNGSQYLYFPNLVSGEPIYLHGSAAHAGSYNLNWRLNPAAFACAPTIGNQPCGSAQPVQQGTLGRNYVRNPPFWAWNTALQRSFPIHERVRLNFRAEAFNILNHPNLEYPEVYLPDSTFGELIQGAFGTIGSSNGLYAMGAPRSLQLSLHLQF